MPDVPAKRGDLILVEERRSSASVNFKGTMNKVYTFQIARSVSRQGKVTKREPIEFYDNPPAIRELAPAVFIIPADRVNTKALIADLRERLQDRQHGWNANTFSSLDDARAFARKFLK